MSSRQPRNRELTIYCLHVYAGDSFVSLRSDSPISNLLANEAILLHINLSFLTQPSGPIK